MGRGDKRTRRGKIFKGSYGNTRKQTTESVKKGASASQSTVTKKAPATKKAK